MFYCIIKIELSFNAYKFSSLQFDFYATMLSTPVTYHSILSHFYNPHLDMNEFLHTLAVLAVCQIYAFFKTLRCRHNERDGVSNHQPHDCLPNRLFRRRSKETSKLRVTGTCVGNSPVTDVFPAQRASNAKNVSIWSSSWRHHENMASWAKKFDAIHPIYHHILLCLALNKSLTTCMYADLIMFFTYTCLAMA